MKVNILVTGPSLKGIVGGQVTHLINIQKVFADDPCHIVSMFSSSSALEGQESRFLKLFWFVVRCVTYPFYLMNINVVHINTTFNNKACIRDSILMSWSLLFRKKVFLQVHGGSLDRVSILKIPTVNKYWFFLLNRCIRVLVLTDEQLKSIVDRNIAQCEKVNNYVQIPTQLPCGSSRFTFSFLGRVVKEKGIFELLLAVDAMKNDFDFILNVYGEGEDLNEFLAKVKELSLLDRVFYKGNVSGAQKDRAFISSNAFLLPSYAEGLPYSLLEAMSYGIPVIASSVGAIPSLIENRKTGLLIKPQSVDEIKTTMIEIINDFPLREYLSAESRKYIIKHHSSDVMKDKFIKLWVK